MYSRKLRTKFDDSMFDVDVIPHTIDAHHYPQILRKIKQNLLTLSVI